MPSIKINNSNVLLQEQNMNFQVHAFSKTLEGKFPDKFQRWNVQGRHDKVKQLRNRKLTSASRPQYFNLASRENAEILACLWRTHGAACRLVCPANDNI